VVTEVRDDSWNLDLIQPYFDTVLEAFGSSRVMFGSDWPVCLLRADYSAWTDVVSQLVAPLSSDEQEAIWGGNAKRFYGF
jgi:L-fuconolactonase